MTIYMPKWIEVIAALYNMSDRDRYCQKLYRKVKMNYSHVRQMIHHLERCSFIKRLPAKKIRYIMLTEKGLALAETALRMKSMLKDAGIND